MQCSWSCVHAEKYRATLWSLFEKARDTRDAKIDHTRAKHAGNQSDILKNSLGNALSQHTHYV
jgi:hypothetical protein